MDIFSQCLNQRITCLGLFTPLLGFVASIIIAIIGLPRLRSYLVSDLEEGRDQLFEERSIVCGETGFEDIRNIVTRNADEGEIEPYTHQDEYEKPENLFDNIEEIEIRQNQGVNSLGEQVIVTHEDPPEGTLPSYDVGSPLAVSNWITTEIEKAQYKVIVGVGFPLLVINFAVQTLVYWYTNVV